VGSKTLHQQNLPVLNLLANARSPVYTHTRLMALSRTTWVIRYLKGKTNLDFTEARDSEWHWHQLGHMQVCTSLQKDNHANTPPLSFFTGRVPFLPPNQQRQSTEGTRFTCIMAVKRVVVLVGIFYYFVCVFLSFVARVCVLIGLSRVFIMS